MKSIYTILILSFLATFGIADEITGLNLRTAAGSQAVNPTAVAGAVLSLDANKRPTFGGPLTFSGANATFASTQVTFGSPGVGRSYWNNTAGFVLGSGVLFGWSSNTDGGAAGMDLMIGRDSAATLQLGTDAEGATTQTIKSADRITSDGVGSDLVIQGGNGRGAAGGSLIFKTSPAAGAGVTGTPTTALTVNSSQVTESSTAIGVSKASNAGYYYLTNSTNGKTCYWQMGGASLFELYCAGTSDFQVRANTITLQTNPSTTAVTIGTDQTVTLSGKFVLASIAAPANAGDTGTAGEVRWDANYIYICTATNTWKRVAIASW